MSANDTECSHQVLKTGEKLNIKRERETSLKSIWQLGEAQRPQTIQEVNNPHQTLHTNYIEKGPFGNLVKAQRVWANNTECSHQVL